MIEVYYKPQLTAERFDGSADMIKKYPIGIMPAAQIDQFGDPDDENNWTEPAFNIWTMEGVLRLRVGDWIAKESGGFKVITDDIFNQRFKELPVIPKGRC